MSDDFLELDPGVVAGAGRRTSAASRSWTSWAGLADTRLRNAAGGSSEAVVRAAFEGYLSRWNPKLNSLAVQADALGANATSAAHTAADGDAESDRLLRQQGATVDSLTPRLSRPINTEPTG